MRRILVLALVASGLIAGPGSPASAATAEVVIDFAGTAPTPAPAVPGARTGGQVTWLQDAPPAHLDPQQIYDVVELSTQLFHRTLTGYREDPAGGPTRLVGDLATNAGESSDGGRVWTYHLRPGSTFEDGSPITSRDIAYGIARSFSEQGAYGPHYLQPALDPSGAYPGPYAGSPVPPGISLPDDQTLVFTFAQPHPELPYLVAFPTTTPVPQARDTQADYDRTFLSTGPYRRIAEVPGVSLTLGRNPAWNPASDPLRHQYADTIHIEWTVDRATQTQRLVTATGTDAAAVMTANVAADQISAVQGDPTLTARTLAGPTGLAKYLSINTRRITDVSVRKALNWAFDRGALIQAQGGTAVGAPLTTVLSPTMPGWLDYDAYPSAGHGDVTQAKQLLRGRKPTLTYCYPDTPDDATGAAVVRTGLQRAGFRITPTPLNAGDYWGIIGATDSTCDLMYSAWVADFPDGNATLGTLLHGSSLAAGWSVNFAKFDEPCVNRRLDDLAAMTDRTAAAPLYGQLDHDVMSRYAPLIPTVSASAFLLHGPGLGGVFLSPTSGRPNLTGAYVR
ncbi:MAG: ABC transporter substrate-binding protein [Hamadaea sp.]|nr:ABC transporter substrate-binding protein [Hamadaea sp.]NUT06349.1 ABC transporter substrate-binding protein [Hamadaea sp.]